MASTSQYQVEWKPAGTWVDITSAVLKVTGGAEITGNRDNALAFGDSSDSRCEIVTDGSLASSAWARTPVRVTFFINGDSVRSFGGIVTERGRSLDILTFKCVGYAELVRATKAYSPPFERRPVATKTTLLSVEDPSSGAYRAGLINWVFWQAGGRPLEQAISYPTATFYYSCDQAALAPKWSWMAGEDGWAECQKLAQASGGQVFQAADGTVMYRQPYGYGDLSAAYTFTQDVYREVEETQSAAKLSDAVRCAWLERAERPLQKVADDSTPRLLYPSQSTTFTVEPSWPVTMVEQDASSLKADALQVTLATGEKATQGTHYSTTVAVSAQQLTVTVTSTTAYPLVVWGYVIKGKPIMASEGGSVVVGSGTNQRSIDDNPYVQSEPHAKRLASLYLKFYASPRPVRSVKGCPFDTDRYVGEVVLLTVPGWSLTDQPHIILSMDHDDTGHRADYKMAYVGDLPKNSDYFQVGPSYTGLSKKVTV